MTWFEQLTGFAEESPESVRRQLTADGGRLRSRANGRSWVYGHLEIPTLAELRERVRGHEPEPGSLSVREVVANVQHLHGEAENENALFQVASQFNLLEMASPAATPEWGVGIYEDDFTRRLRSHCGASRTSCLRRTARRCRVRYTEHERDDWAPFAKLILEAAYEATLCAAIINRRQTASSRLYLTLLGGGAFGNHPAWITDAIRRAFNLYSDFQLDVCIVSHGASRQDVRRIVNEFS